MDWGLWWRKWGIKLIMVCLPVVGEALEELTQVPGWVSLVGALLIVLWQQARNWVTHRYDLIRSAG